MIIHKAYLSLGSNIVEMPSDTIRKRGGNGDDKGQGDGFHYIKVSNGCRYFSDCFSCIFKYCICPDNDAIK